MSEHRATRAVCAACGCLLAADNSSTRCTPCDRADRYQASPTPSIPLGLRALQEHWAEGFDSYRDAAGLDNEGAADLAVRLGLVKARELTAERLAALAEARDTPTTVLAEHWGLSRWTVADWRSQLRLRRLSRARPPGSRTPPEPVVGIEILIGPRTRLVTTSGPIRLGRTARVVLDELVSHHPDEVDAADLAATAFPDAAAGAGTAALQAAVYRLRRHLPAETIVRTMRGYRLNVASTVFRSSTGDL